MENILWLASWYPNKLDKYDGDFIQRHAKAASLFCSVTVIYVKKDTGLKPNAVVSEKFFSGNLTEHIIYYNPFKTGISIVDRLLSQLKYHNCFRKAAKKYIKEHGKPAYVHVHVAMNAGITALWMKRKWNIGFFVTEHWTGYHKQAVPSVHSYNPVFQRMNKKILKNASLFLPVSKNLGDIVNQDFINIPYHIIPNVVDTDVFYLKNQIASKFRFIHVSHMNYQKNPEGIMKAAAILKEKGYVFEIIMLGNDNNALRSLAKKDGLLNENVFFQPPVAYKEVAEQMQNASALLLFSRFENLPCVILEALCCGLPVISSNVGGIPEVINETNGILVESGEFVQLAEAMETLITNYRQYDRYAISGLAAEKYNYNVVGRQFYEAYSKKPAKPV